MDLVITAAGDATGSLVKEGHRVEILLSGDDSAILAGKDYWDATAPAESAARSGKWVKSETSPLGVDIRGTLGPRTLGLQLRDTIAATPPWLFRQGTPASLDGVRAIEYSTSQADLYVSPQPPYRLLRLRIPNANGRLPTALASAVDLGNYARAAGVGELDFQGWEINLPKILRNGLTTSGGTSGTDGSVGYEFAAGSPRFAPCGTGACTIAAVIINDSGIHATSAGTMEVNMTGDGVPVDACQTEVPPLRPGTQIEASCSLGAGWSEWSIAIRDVPGLHPYIAMVLAVPTSCGDKVTGEALKQLRSKFNSTIKPSYWKREAANKPNPDEPWSEKNLNLMRNGNAPIGPDMKPMVLHHIIPLSRGGTNDFSNLTSLTSTDHTSNFGALHPCLWDPSEND